MATILIVEDELLIAGDIERAMRRLGHSPLEPVDNSEDALAVLAQQAVELVLMDVNIVGDTDGIATALQIRRQYNLPVVFLTARTDPATVNRAKVAQPYGYITKPFTDDSLRVTVELALYNAYQLTAAARIAAPAPVAEVNQVGPTNKGDAFLFVRKGARYEKIFFQEILCFEAAENFVKIFTAEGQCLVDSSLKELEHRLPHSFVRTHRSHIVNLGHVTAYEEGYVEIKGLQKDDKYLPVSRTHRDELKSRLHLLG